ncbi:succinate dehydrogenase cytochrome b subunit [Geomonas sp. Red32]|uniref:succinate dehydrogenase cytochrome b subunit n=1 Tax=Geomonas sp. Red32 TaxID=2912856 RepID=UPI00202CEC35|nr:succinate dehydrogenase cytochrome b subunit [Geomonas sp. Red32]MCM0082492.1 succinate dehydrogenase cytochrome b subunit [Geomonas sp. Red32]
MRILTSTVGRKILMSITGQLLILFVLIHMIGNTTIFFGALNAYAEHLHSLPPLVWIFRLVMLSAIAVHICYGVQVTLENKAANPGAYAVKKQLKANFASENMIWTGLLLALFILYHLAQFTMHLTPDVVVGLDAINRPDVFKMVSTSFANAGIAVVYFFAMIMLFLHLSHGIPSFLQTMGWNNDKTIPVFGTGGKVVSAFLMLVYISIPAAILVGALK